MFGRSRDCGDKHCLLSPRFLYREVLGARLNDAFKCPLASPYFAEGNLDNQPISNYMLYPSNNWRSKHFGYATQEAYQKLGRGFRPRSEPDVKFGLLASDIAFGSHGYAIGGAALSGHPAPSGSMGEFRSVINSHTGYNLGTEADFTASANYVDDDGSVHTFRINGLSHTDGANWVTNDRYKYLLPRALAR